MSLEIFESRTLLSGDVLAQELEEPQEVGEVMELQDGSDVRHDSGLMLMFWVPAEGVLGLTSGVGLFKTAQYVCMMSKAKERLPEAGRFPLWMPCSGWFGVFVVAGVVSFLPPTIFYEPYAEDISYTEKALAWFSVPAGFATGLTIYTVYNLLKCIGKLRGESASYENLDYPLNPITDI